MHASHVHRQAYSCNTMSCAFIVAQLPQTEIAARKQETKLPPNRNRGSNETRTRRKTRQGKLVRTLQAICDFWETCMAGPRTPRQSAPPRLLTWKSMNGARAIGSRTAPECHRTCLFERHQRSKWQRRACSISSAWCNITEDPWQICRTRLSQLFTSVRMRCMCTGLPEMFFFLNHHP